MCGTYARAEGRKVAVAIPLYCRFPREQNGRAKPSFRSESKNPKNKDRFPKLLHSSSASRRTRTILNEEKNLAQAKVALRFIQNTWKQN